MNEQHKIEQLTKIAHELLASLSELLDLTDDPDNDADPEESAFTHARLVIAKARDIL